MSKYDGKTLTEEQSMQSRSLRGMIRRMAVQATSALLWRLKGHTIEGVTETPLAQPFQGVGFFSRPAKGSRAEAIMVSVGEAQHAVIVATRDEDLRRLHKTALEAGPDMAAMFNSATIVIINPSGTVEIRSRLGVAQSTIKGEQYTAAEQAMLPLLSALCTALATSCPPLGTVPQQAATAAAATAAATAIDAFIPGDHLTTVLKAE